MGQEGPLTLRRLADHAVLHFLQAADVLPLPCGAVQNHARVQRQEAGGRGVLPVGEFHWVLAKPPHVLTWKQEVMFN